MKRLLWYVSCCCTLSLIGAATAHASPKQESSGSTTTGTAASLGRVASDENQLTNTVTVAPGILAQTPPPPPAPTDTPATPTTPTTPTTAPAGSDTQEIQRELKTIEENKPQDRPAAANADVYNPKTSPQFAIFNPVGFGADRNLFFLSGSYQSRTRFGNTSDGELGFGVGLGNAIDFVGLELSYGINSFGSSSGFGSGAFSAKLHKRVSEDTSVAIGWNQFAQVQFGSGATDYPKNSYYLAATKIFRTTDDINAPFSRVAATAGVGGGVFLPFDGSIPASQARDGLGVFGSLGIRVVRPVSAVVEWTGQDLAAGVSVAPFDSFPLVITPAFRDITGISGQSARFVLGASVAFNF